MGGAISIPEVKTADDQYLIDAIQEYLDLIKALFAELAGEDEEDTEMKDILNNEVQLGTYLQKVSDSRELNHMTIHPPHGRIHLLITFTHSLTHSLTPYVSSYVSSLLLL